MPSSLGVKSRQSATSISSRAYIYSPSAFSSSRSTSSPKPATVHGKSSSASLAYRMNRKSASPGSSIWFQKMNRVNNANAVPSNKKKAVCMCSPTMHPGWFRCSLHRKWKNSVNSANEPSSSSTLKNSIARIGGDEGADLVKRALSATIRHCSHQQRQAIGLSAKT